MIRDITLGQYYPGSSLIHRMDPRFKIVATLVYIVGLFMVTKFFGFIFPLVYLILAIAISRVPLGFILRGMKPIIIILVCTFVINLFMIDGGKVLVDFRFTDITEQGLKSAVFLASRLIMLIIASSLLTYTTKPVMLTDGIESLLKPMKLVGLPAHELAMMMSIALRFIPTLLEETDKIMKAQMARGADFETGSLMNRLKGLVPILIPLFISSLRRAEDLAMAMEARCYKGGEGRTRLHTLKFGKIDWVGTVVTVLMMVGIVFTMK